MNRPALDHPLEAAELGDVEVGVDDLTIVVELDRDLGVALDPGDGIDDDVRHACDEVVRVPIHGRAESLNLAMAATVCLYASAGRQAHQAGQQAAPPPAR